MVLDAKECVLCQCERWIMVFHLFCFGGSQKMMLFLLQFLIDGFGKGSWLFF